MTRIIIEDKHGKEMWVKSDNGSILLIIKGTYEDRTEFRMDPSDLPEFISELKRAEAEIERAEEEEVERLMKGGAK